MIAQIIIGATRLLVGGHARWQGCAPAASQRIYVANHASHLDAILLWAALPPALRRTTHPVAARDYWGRDAVRRFIATRVLNAVLVDRDGCRDPLAPLRAELDRGHSLILFPEGTRGTAAEPGRFRSGIYHIARAFPGVDLVPVYLNNLGRAFPKGAILPAPIMCTVAFGASTRLGSDERRAPFLDRMRDAVWALADGGRS